MAEQTPVPDSVLRGIEEVRDSGEVNMFNREWVMRQAESLGYLDTVEWIHHHPREYHHGIMYGFTPEG